jgi:hypothetical protein
MAILIAGHDVRTTVSVGWASLKNGELLTLAANDFDVFITVDRNLSFQQNLPKYDIALLVLRASTNRLADLAELVPIIEATIFNVGNLGRCRDQHL